MGMFDDVIGALGGGALPGGLDPATLGARFGLSPEQVTAALAALGRAAPQPGDTAGAAADATGLPIEALRGLLEQVGGEAMVAKIAAMLGQGGAAGGLGGALGGLFGQR